MPKKAKIRSINILKKWKTWHIKSESKTSILLLYCEILSYYQLIILSIILCFLGKSRVETRILQYISDTLTDHYFSEPQIKHSLLASHPAEPHPTDQSSLDLQKSRNLNISSYFINTLEFPHVNTWHHRVEPITQTINRFGLNPNHQRSVEHSRKTFISCIEQGVK